MLKLDRGESAVTIELVSREDFQSWLTLQTQWQQNWLNAAAFEAKNAQTILLPDAHGALDKILVIGDAKRVYSLAHLALSLPEGDYRVHAPGGALAELALGFVLGGYRFERYLKPKRTPARMLVAKELLEQVQPLVDAVVRARDLVNTPTEDLGPEHLQAKVQALAEQQQAHFRARVGAELLSDNFPAIHAVGRASHRAPRLLELDSKLADQALPLLCIVGKGVCFDTGGLDIKPADGMAAMKKDMGGAAVALALAQWVLESKLKVRLKLLIPAVENAIGPDAYRPGEVISTRHGYRVEIGNTDAEGRVILCDALTYALESKPDLLIDFATLTGAARIALGPDLPPVFAHRQSTREALIEHGVRREDPLWPMPLHSDYEHYLKSTIADFNNAGSSRMAGCITAALYLQKFVPSEQDWLHIDTYCWNDRDRPGRPQGGECQSLRASISYLSSRYGHATV